jgi:putative hydrolase of HD superfamily
VARKAPINSLGRDENDSEHSYSLAIVAWKIVTNDNLPLDLDLVIKYALIHDLVEVYAGDVLTFGDDDRRVNKEENEQKALEKLKTDETLSDITSYIEKYEQKADEESLFVYGLDKLLPPVIYIMNNAITLKQHGVSFDKWQTKIKSMTDKSKYLAPYYEQVLDTLKKNRHLFVDEEDS